MWPVASEDTLITHLLAKTWLAVLTLSTVNKRRCLGVEAVQTIGVLVDEGVVLRNELPTNFGRVNGGVCHHNLGLCSIRKSLLGKRWQCLTVSEERGSET